MSPNVTIVHERFTEFAGSEQVVAQLAEQWPQARVVAPVARPESMPTPLRERIESTRLSALLRGDSYAHLLPALPVAMRHLPLGDPDVIIASHHAFASQVVHSTAAPVIAYVHSPARWIWDADMRKGEPGGPLLGAFAAGYRGFDRRAAAQLTAVVANSSAVADRIARWWEVPARVIHPPVDTDYYTAGADVPREDFMLLAGRLVPYKRPDLAIRAAERAGVRLLVAGDGRMRAECERLAGPNTEFLGRVPDAEFRSLFQRCAALLMPGIEDFGIVPVEAQACGAPVIATGAGGALDSVQDGTTGELVPAGEDGLLERWTTALRDFDPARYETDKIRANAEGFSIATFRARMQELVDQTVG